MRRTGVVDQLTAHRGLDSLPGVFGELACGRVSAEEAIRRARTEEEDEELAQRTARMLAPPTAAQSQARLQVLLEHWATSPETDEPSAPSSGRWIFGVVALTAAAVLLVVMPRVQPGVGAFEAGYELELERALAVQRDAPGRDDVLQYRLDRPIQLTVRPAHRVIEPIDARAFAIRADGHAIALPIEPRISELGVVEIIDLPRALGLRAGRWQLVVVVGPPAGLPTAARDVRMDSDAPYDVERAWIEVLEEALE